MDTDDRILDLPAIAAEVREEALITLAFVQLVRGALRGVRVPAKVRKLLAQAERAAHEAREHARRLDAALTVASETRAKS